MVPGYSLYDMLQRMTLCLLEIVTSIERIVPDVQEEVGPFPASENESVWHEAILVLTYHQIYFFRLQSCECFDDTVRRDDWNVDKHHAFQLLLVHNMILYFDICIHNQGAIIDVEEV